MFLFRGFDKQQDYVSQKLTLFSIAPILLKMKKIMEFVC